MNSAPKGCERVTVTAVVPPTMEPSLPQVPVDLAVVEAQETAAEQPVEETPRYESDFAEAVAMNQQESSRKGFALETTNDLLNNETTKALQRASRSNSITSSSVTLRAELEGRSIGIVDWTKMKNREKLRDVCRLLRRLFWAFEEVEIQAVGETRAGMNNRPASPRPGWSELTFRKKVSVLVHKESFTGFFLFLTVYALLGPDMCAAYGHTPLSTKDNTLAVVNTIVLFAFFLEEVLHSIGIPGYTCSTRFWIDTLATFSIIGDSVIGTELLQSDAFVALRGSRLSRILRVGGRSSKLVRFLRLTRLVQIVRLVPKLQEWMQRSTNELAFQLWLKRVMHVAKFVRGPVRRRFTPEDWDLLTTAMEIEFPMVSKGKRRGNWIRSLRCTVTAIKKPGIVADLSWLSRTASENAGGISFSQLADDLITLPVGKRSYQSCRDDINCMKESCAIVENASNRLTLKVCILVLMLLITMQLLVSHDADNAIIQGLHQVDILSLEAPPVDPVRVCEFIKDYSQVSSQSDLLLLVTDGRPYWRPGCSCCDASEVASRPPIVDFSLLVEQIADDTGLELHEVLIEEVFVSEDVQTVAVFDTHRVERALALNALLQTVTVVILLTFLVLYFATDMKKLSNDNVLHPLWDLMDDMCSLQCIELLGSGFEEPEHLNARALYHKHFARIPALKRGCCYQQIPVAEELNHLRNAFDKLRTAILSWSKYVPVVLLKQLVEARVEAAIGCSFCEVCVVFLAIADFEHVCADMNPQEVLDLMAGVLNGIYDALNNNGGVMLEFIGDEVLAVFNAPTKVFGYQINAISAALEAQENIHKFRQDVSLLASVHKASVLVGNLGSPTRMKYGVLGDGVNLSARLKSLNTRYNTRLLVSAEALDFPGSRDHFIYRPVGHLVLKGRNTPTKTFEVMAKADLGAKKLTECADMHREAFELFVSRQFLEAKALFSKVHGALSAPDVAYAGADKVSKHFVALCDSYIASPPGKDWDGSEVLKKKAFN